MATMPDLYDRLENRVPQTRETFLFRDLRHILSITKSRAPAIRAQLKGIEIASLTARAELARIPILRARDLAALQAEAPPFGGLCATRPSALKQIFTSPGAIAVPEGKARDWWGAARALYVAGLRKGMIAVNCFSCEQGPDANMMASGAEALGCPVIWLGAGALDFKVKAIAHLKPRFYCGTADHLKRILDHAAETGADVSTLRNGLVMGDFAPGLRNEISLRGLHVKLAFARPELGVVAFESGATEGLTLNEGLILEFVDPSNGQIVEPGKPGEMVVTRLNPDYPLLRFGTGAVSAQLLHRSTCGRTNMRIRTPQEYAAESAECRGIRLHSGQLVEIAKRHPSLGRLRLVVRRSKEQDVLILRAEHRGDEKCLSESLSETLHRVTQMRGTIELVSPGSLRDDESGIIDERPLN
jgi:phenylacetate-CoA ligase